MDVFLVGDAFLVQVKISGRRSEGFNALLDTGASLVHLHNEECMRLGLKLEGGKGVTCVHGDKKDLPIYEGKVDVRGVVSTEKILGLPIKLKVNEKEVKAILGRSPLTRSKVILDWRAKKGIIE